MEGVECLETKSSNEKGLLRHLEYKREKEVIFLFLQVTGYMVEFGRYRVLE